MKDCCKICSSQTVDKKAKINSKKISFGFLNKKEKKENPKK